MSIFNISTSPTNPIRVSPPTSSAIEVATTQQLSKTTISRGSRIGSYQNRSTYINHDAVVLRCQLLSKNMREGTFNFYTFKPDPYSLSYISTYLTSQKISTIYYLNYFNLPTQSEELSTILSLYNPVAHNLKKQYTLVVTNTYLESGDTETLLNAIANEYASNYNGTVFNIIPALKAFTIDFNQQKLNDAIAFADSDNRISGSFQDGYVGAFHWTGSHHHNQPPKKPLWPPTDNYCVDSRYPFRWLYSDAEARSDWPRTLCAWKWVQSDNPDWPYEILINKTPEELIAELPSCWGHGDYQRSMNEVLDFLSMCTNNCGYFGWNIKPFARHFPKKAFVYAHLDRLDQADLPLNRGYAGRTKPRNRLIANGGTCESLKEPVYAYVVDQSIGPTEFKGKYAYQHPNFEGRLNQFYGPIISWSWTAQHGEWVASLIAGRNTGVTRKPELVSVGVLTRNGGSLSMIAQGIGNVIQDRVDYPDRKMIMNLSLGADIDPTSPLNIMEYAILDAIDKDIIVVVAAGNSSMDARNSSPARLDEVITVGATQIKRVYSEYGDARDLYNYAGQLGNVGYFWDELAEFSNYGPKVDLYSMGQGIVPAYMSIADRYTPRYVEDATYVDMTDPSRRIRLIRGTSFSSPLVAGVACEVLRKIGKVNQKQMKEILIGYSAGGERGIKGEYYYKDTYGIINLDPEYGDHNRLLQNPFHNCGGMETIDDLDDEDDCAANPNINPQIAILNQPAINMAQNKIVIDVKLLHNTVANPQYLYIPNIGIEWQRRSYESSTFVPIAYGSELDTTQLTNGSILRAAISFPGITGDDWSSNENSIISNEIIFDTQTTPTPTILIYDTPL